MGHALIWVESLAAALLLVALVTAVAARWRRRYGRGVIPVVLAVVLVAAAVAATAGLCYLHYQFDRHPISNPQSLAMIAWTLFLAGGSAAVLVGGLRRGPDLAPAARAWSRSRLGLGFAALVVVTTITLTNLDLAVRIQLSAVRAEAGAKTLAAAPPRVPDADNAALVYQEAFDALAPEDRVPAAFHEKVPPTWREDVRPPLDPQDKELREFLRAQERGLALVRKAAAMPQCSFDRDYSLGFALPVPELTRLRYAARLLAYDAAVKSADGDVRGALADVATVYGVARHINEPLLIAVATAVGVEKAAARTLQEVIDRADPAGLAGLPPADPTSYRRAVRRAMATEEAAFGLAAITGIAAGDPDLVAAAQGVFNAVGVTTLASPLYRVFFLEDDLAAYRRVMRDVHRLTAKPYHEARPEWEAFDKSWQTHRRGILTSLLAPAVDRLVVSATEADAERLLARTAVALVGFKAKTGSYPDRLDALVPEFLPRVPADPFADGKLKLKRDGAGVVVYSVGRDLKDDGGQPPEPGTTGGDLTFRLK